MTRLHPIRRALLFLAALLMPAGASAQALVAAASDLRPALTAIARDFERDTGQRVRVVFGSSGNFYRQLSRGARFEMFLSADEHYVQRLAAAKRTIDGGHLYAVGRLAIVAPKGSRLAIDGELRGLRAALRAGRLKRFAIANPQFAPYGARAQEALGHAGLLVPIKPHLVYGENVSQAMQFATAGGADGGIVAHSLVLDPAVRGRVRHALVPADWHAPLRQRMVLMRGAGPVARRFYAYLRSTPARAVLSRFGFAVPGGG